MNTLNESNAPIYLSTGIDELDGILATDIDQPEVGRMAGGFLVGRQGNDQDRETPIILINGETGTGKTTLILQIAFSAAEERDKWLPCFCALEQTVRSLENMAVSFGNFGKAHVKGNGKEDSGKSKDVVFYDLAVSEGEQIDFNNKNPGIYLVHLAPRPITDGGNTNLFQTRLNQLDHMIEKIKANNQTGALPVFFIDSINAFSMEELSRNEIYRLFSLFRNQHVPAILTMEHHWNRQIGVESDNVQNAKFLADIVISLTKDSSSGYLKYYLEVEKSRVSRQALGRHLYKIRTNLIADEIHHDPRTGIVLYPSIHFVLSKARENTVKAGGDYFVSEADEDLQNIMKSTSIRPGACFSIIGPPGTHKLALGMNLSMGYKEGKLPSLLVVNFGGSKDFKFDGVAWTQSRQYCKWLTQTLADEGESEVKFWKTQYRYQPKQERGKESHDAQVTIVTFRIGQLTPEECFYVIEKVIRESNENQFSSVLLSDTAELCNGFPLLASDPLFLPVLIDLFATRKLVTVCIGVDEGQSAKNTDINFSLSSRADYRIVLSHYPDIQRLSEYVVNAFLPEQEGKKKSDRYPNEQLVSLVVDNVTGKHYGRELKWLYVTTSNEGKTLHCSTTPWIDWVG